MSDFRIDGPWGFAALPPLARAEVRRLRRVTARSARGRVLDLGGPDVDLGPYAGRDDVSSVHLVSPVRSERLRQARSARDLGLELHLEATVPPAGRFDSVLSVVRLVSAVDAGRLAHSLLRLAAPEGQLLVAEPTTAGGPVGRLRRFGAPVVRDLFGIDPDFDPPALLRGAGWHVAEVRRERVSLLAAPLRSVVLVTARRAPLEPDRGQDIDQEDHDG